MNELLRRLLALPPQASTIARDVDTLHYAVILSTMLGATVVAGVAAYFVIRYREGARRPLPSPRAKGAPRGEWVLIGGTFALFLGFWVVGLRQYIALRTPPRGALEVYVSAKQWMWKFAYADGGESIDVLTVPVGRPVELVMTSRDVIHSFYVPAFRVKYDVVPGRYTTAWFEATEPGEYPIYCAEFCGVSHSLMKGRVVVLGAEAYAAWLEGRARTSDSVPLAERGRLVAVRNQCFACHSIDGRNHIGPSWRGLFGSTVSLEGGRRAVVDEAYLSRSMMRPLDDVVVGYRPVMPSYEGLLSGPDTAALVEYIRALRDAPAEVGAPSMGDPRQSIVGGGVANAGEGTNTGLAPSGAVGVTSELSPRAGSFAAPSVSPSAAAMRAGSADAVASNAASSSAPSSSPPLATSAAAHAPGPTPRPRSPSLPTRTPSNYTTETTP